MLGIVSELRRHKSQFVIVRATDSLDMLFLARYLRTEYPQGRIVTIGADMLFRRESEDPRLHGVLALSTYSLAPEANHYFESYEQKHIERIFPSSLEVGIVNAMRSLLTAWVIDSNSLQNCNQDQDNNGDDSVHCRHSLQSHGDSPLTLYQYGWPYQSTTKKNPSVADIVFDAPPVNLLALGRDDYWPIASLGPFHGEKMASTLPRISKQYIDPPSGDIPQVPIPKSWRLLELIGIAAGLGFSVCLWCSSVFCRTETLAKYAPAFKDSRSTPILITGLGLILCMLILLWPWIHGGKSEWPVVEWSLVGSLILVFLCTCIDWISRFILGTNLKVGAGQKDYVGIVLASLPFLGFLVFLTLVALRITRYLPQDIAVVLYSTSLRATQLTSGLSFIVPALFFLSVWIWWAEHVTSGLTLLDDRRPRLPRDMKNRRVLGLGEAAQSQVKKAYELSWSRTLTYWAILVCVIGASRLLGDATHPLLTLETPHLEKYLWFLFALAIAGILVTVLRLWEVWLPTRTLLVTLDSLPLRRGFKRIKGFSWNPIWKLGAGSLEEFQRLYAREREALICALNTASFEHSNLDTEWQKVLTALNEAKQQENGLTTGWWARRKLEIELVRQFAQYQEEVAKVAGVALDRLASFWDHHKEEPTVSNTRVEIVPPEIRAHEQFVCSVFISLLIGLLVRIRTLIVAISGMYVLTLIGISQYPFEPKATLQVILIVLLAVLVLVVGWVLAQIHRDATLSAITDTNPAELGADFWLRLINFGALPLFSLLASQVPTLNKLFYSWVQPMLEALNR